MVILFWDIDGTLLTTGRAGILAWEDACLEITGRQYDFQSFKTDGLTDHQVAVHMMEHAGSPPSDVDLGRMVAAYERHLPGRLHQRKGRVLDGVLESLQYFRDKRADVHSMLLTGNTEAGARAKLRYYELMEFFEGGSFSTDPGPRSTIATRALREVRGRFPEASIGLDHVFVIGDTPHDIDCARAIGARAIGIASGVYDLAALQAHGAWYVGERVPPPQEFEAILPRFCSLCPDPS